MHKMSHNFFKKYYFLLGVFLLESSARVDAENGQPFCLTPSELEDRLIQSCWSTCGPAGGKGLRGGFIIRRTVGACPTYATTYGTVPDAEGQLLYTRI